MKMGEVINGCVRSGEKHLTGGRVINFKARQMRIGGSDSISRPDLLDPSRMQIMSDDGGDISRNGALIRTRVDLSGGPVGLPGLGIKDPDWKDRPAGRERAIDDGHQ